MAVRKEKHSPVKLSLVVMNLVLASRPELMFMVCSQDYCNKEAWHGTRRKREIIASDQRNYRMKENLYGI
jgi:hypothetical protein